MVSVLPRGTAVVSTSCLSSSLTRAARPTPSSAKGTGPVEAYAKPRELLRRRLECAHRSAMVHTSHACRHGVQCGHLTSSLSRSLMRSKASRPRLIAYAGLNVETEARAEHVNSQVEAEEGSARQSTVSSESLIPSLEAEGVKAKLRQSLEGLNRGIFGVQSSKKAEIESLVAELEALNPLPRPTDSLELVAGEWRLLYSTISILGARRTKLGLREFVKLGEFRQIIDLPQSRAVNRVEFNVVGLSSLKGSLTIEASFSVASPTRVNIKFQSAQIVPEQLLSIFQKSYDLLLSIFNPEGWLEITYVDNFTRIGRDDKGNVFLVERERDSESSL